MISDVQSFDREKHPAVEPSAWITRFASLIQPGGKVLDLACGHGRHTRWLATKGFSVLAADIDVAGLGDLRDNPRVEILEIDLEADSWPFASGGFAGVVIANYLHRPHFTRLPGILAEGGVLLIDTFGAGNERFGRPRNPDFLLQPGELIDAFHPALQVIAYEHGLEWTPRPAVRQRLCAVKGSALQTLPGDG
ncbi:MAG: class I SAM-dependent methyltransferase [Gammaproteobacteria bacterium]|nr:class I SAM-dependent methyltransferase [Gammaproteobacteria bacterium]